MAKRGRSYTSAADNAILVRELTKSRRRSKYQNCWPDSDLLHKMAHEALTVDGPDCCGAGARWSNLKGIGVYAYGASAPDRRLFNNARVSLQDFFKEKLHIDLQRSIANDDTLADGITKELNRRNVYPDADPKHKDEVALISEWDTFYGQTLPKVVEQRFGCQNANCG